MNFSSVYERQKRNPSQMYHPMHNSVANYWTEAFQKREMKQEYSDEMYLNNLHLIPDPLKKNLADTLFTTERLSKPDKMPQCEPLHRLNMLSPPQKEENTGSTLGGIGSFFSGVLNVISGVMFRTRSPASYYDCFDVDGHQGSPQGWQRANTDVQDKNGQPVKERQSYDVPPNPNVSTDMNPDRTVTSCENKLNQVLNLLAPKQRQNSSPVWLRKRPKKVFVEPGSVSDSFEDAFSPEDFVSLSDDSFIEYYSPVQYHNGELHETAAQKTMLNMAPYKENMEIVKDVANKCDLELKKDCGDLKLEQDQSRMENVNSQSDEGNTNTEQVNMLVKTYDDEKDSKLLEKESFNKEQTGDWPAEVKSKDNTVNCQLVSSCEDKLSKLKALLLEKRKKNSSVNSIPECPTMQTTNTIPIEKNPADKRFKNPNRRTDKRRKTKLKCKIEDDLLFANEISLGTPPSVENSPTVRPKANFGEYFDEVSGRFRSASIGSEDSFQIVFNDTPKHGRIRTTSDCDSEDSFIVFEDSPESCYMSNDVFGDTDDSDSDVSDSGCGMVTCKLAHTLTRTVSNLADDSLYTECEDEVDFGNVETVSDVPEEVSSGLLLDDKKKQLRRDLPSKKVRFSTAPPKVHVMRVWAFAARQARAGHWERYAVDRERFKRRIADVDVAVSWVLRPQHRRRVMFQRFMPWWNQLKRKELAVKKEKEEEGKRRQENEERWKDNSNIETENKLENKDVNNQKEELNCPKGLEYNNNKSDVKENQEVPSNIILNEEEKKKEDLREVTGSGNIIS